MVQQTIKIKSPIQTVYSCIVDFESYPQFLPDVKSAKIVWCEDKQMEVIFRLDLIKQITYTLVFDCDPPEEIHWKLKTGDLMKANTGSWKLKMLDDFSTEATYVIDIEFGLWVPKVITQTLIEKSLPQTLKRFKKRTEKNRD